MAMGLETVDDPRAGQRLDQMLLELSARSQRTAREAVCTLTVAQARLLRLARLGQLDLAAELARPEPDARVVALLDVRRRRDRSVLPTVRTLVRDPQLPVASAALRVIVTMADSDSIPALQMLAIDPDSIELHGLACRALWDMGVPDACGGRPREDAVGGMLQGSTSADPCAVAKSDMRSPDSAKVDAALEFFLSSSFVSMTHDLDPVWIACTNCAPAEACRPSGRRLRRIARGESPLSAALASAVLLLRAGVAPATGQAP